MDLQIIGFSDFRILGVKIASLRDADFESIAHITTLRKSAIFLYGVIKVMCLRHILGSIFIISSHFNFQLSTFNFQFYQSNSSSVVVEAGSEGSVIISSSGSGVSSRL